MRSAILAALQGESSMRLRSALAAAFTWGTWLVTASATETYATIESLDPRFEQLVPADTKIEKIADDLLWSEGPLWDSRAKHLLFSDIPRNVVMRWHDEKGVARFLENSGYTGAAPFTGREPGSNGLTFDLQGRLTLCQHGDRRVSRRETDGKLTPLATSYQGKKLNSPNDLVFHRDGALYFTDPPYGLPGTFKDPSKELDFQGVYRVDATGKISLLTKELEAPNGLAFAPDFKTLYVANSQKHLPIWKAFPVNPDGSLGPSRLFADSSKLYQEGDGVPDGLKVDVKGNVFATGPGGVLVYAPDGTLLGRILTGVPTANVAFGEDGATLFVTANHRVLRLRTKTQGAPLPTQK
jgi:gluconolactonase